MTEESFSISDLQQQWRALIGELAPNADTNQVLATFEDLVQRYSEPTRAHHTLEHISEMLTLISAHESALASPNEVKAATWFHDIIYNSRATDNEEQSIEHARRKLTMLGVTPKTIDVISSYILATKQHELPADCDPNSDLAFFLDADMSILASEGKRYREYALGSAFEYGWATNIDGKDLYTPARLQFLRKVSSRPIFHTDIMQPLEEQARTNIDWEIMKLQT
ncbi:MAG: hypothetical protein WBO77_03355 [Microgenomates group bacterium]